MSSPEPANTDWAEYEKAHPIVVPPELVDPHPVTRKTAAVHFGWMAQPDEIPKPDDRDCFRVRTSERHRDRALRLIDTLLKAGEVRGFVWRRDETNRDHPGLSVFVDNESIPLSLIERGGVITNLVLEITGRSSKRMWKDHPRRPLEKRLNEVMTSLRNIAHNRIADRQDAKERELREQEFQRQRTALRREVQEEQQAFDDLIAEAGDWQTAMTVRAYIAAFKAQSAREGTSGEHSDWITWANDQADRLDPLLSSPPSLLDTPRDAYREPGWEEYIDSDGNIAHA